jgi:hypothetical protein
MNSNRNKPAWEKWEGELPIIDNLDNEPTKAKNYLVKILSIVEAGKDFTDLIPDAGPIPVGSLVKVVVQLMSTGKVSFVYFSPTDRSIWIFCP